MNRVGGITTFRGTTTRHTVSFRRETPVDTASERLMHVCRARQTTLNTGSWTELSWIYMPKSKVHQLRHHVQVQRPRQQPSRRRLTPHLPPRRGRSNVCADVESTSPNVPFARMADLRWTCWIDGEETRSRTRKRNLPGD
jgi:hypothetical protein